MQIVFMGTPDFSVPVLEALAGSGHQVIGAVTQPDKPKGRGKSVVMTPVKEKALELGIPVYQPVKVRDPEFVQVLKNLNPDIIVVVAFGQILPRQVLEVPAFGCVNIHASLLPRYRGAAPIQWAVIDGERESGVTTMMMDEGLDTGDMLEKASIVLSPDETGGSLHDKLSAMGAQLILSTLSKIQDGTITRTPQTDENTCYARMLKKSMGDIDWTMDAVSIERLIRGLNPWPSAYTRWDQKTLKIWKAQVLEQEYEGTCGEVVYRDKHAIYVKTGKGTLSLKELQPEGKKRMEVEAFLRGYPVEMHTVFERSC